MTDIASSIIEDPNIITFKTGSTFRAVKVLRVDTGSVAEIRDPKLMHSARLKATVKLLRPRK
jgi:hypothetical protein